MSNLPDTKLAAITWIRGHAGLPAGVTVSGAVPDDLTSSLPLAVVFRPNSPPAMHYARWDRAALNVQVWAATEKSARDAASAVYDVLHAAIGVSVSGVVLRVADQDITGIGELPDPGYPDLYRQAFTVSATARNA